MAAHPRPLPAQSLPTGWQDHQPYDEARYLAALQHRHPALYQLARNTRLPSDQAPA
ncbi:hypothetical protein [Opitutus terrae]|uniref:hypothetical protein n=1 Tax=Opitutus terrae TaxID=107709 RepID=UPI0002E60BAF|nr:hypothetical protein [Opitutus terrae]